MQQSGKGGIEGYGREICREEQSTRGRKALYAVFKGEPKEGRFP